MPRASPEHDVDGLLALSGLAQPSSDGQLSVGQPRRMLVSPHEVQRQFWLSGCQLPEAIRHLHVYQWN